MVLIDNLLYFQPVYRLIYSTYSKVMVLVELAYIVYIERVVYAQADLKII